MTRQEYKTMNTAAVPAYRNTISDEEFSITPVAREQLAQLFNKWTTTTSRLSASMSPGEGARA